MPPAVTPQEEEQGDTSATLHASCVALEGRALLITGASGRGKSGLALQMMALGAGLVADDRTCLRRSGAAIIASPPAAIAGRIEARGLGILAAARAGPTRLAAVLDLDRAETKRLPPERRVELLGVALPLLHNVETPHFPAALVQYLKAGRNDLMP